MNGELIAQLLAFVVPVSALGALIWKLSDSLRGVRELAQKADSKADIGLDRTGENTRAIGDLNIRLARDHPLKSDIKTDLKEMEARIIDKLEILIERVAGKAKRAGGSDQ